MAMTVDAFFGEQELSRQLFAAVQREVELLGESSMRVSKSQISFRRGRNFAFVWMPDQYLKRKAGPLVLTVSLPWHDSSPRWKQVVEPYPGRFTHHLELYDVQDVDDDVRSWLRQAWQAAA